MSFMERALVEARSAARRGEVPVGAVVVRSGTVVSAAGNSIITAADPTAHAEIVAIREACVLAHSERLADHDLYVTLEPCAMCAGAIALARIRRLYFGASDPKGGGVEHGPRVFDQPTTHHRPDVYGGFSERACAAILSDFFRHRRNG